MCLVGGEAGWGWVGWGVLLNNPHVCLAATRQSCALPSWTTASASTASAACSPTAKQNCATAPSTQHTSSKRRLRVGCDAFCEIDWREGAVADVEARLAYRIEQKRLQAVQRRAEAELRRRNAELAKWAEEEIERRLPCVQWYIHNVKCNPALLSSFVDPVALGHKHRFQEWLEMREARSPAC